MKNQVQLITYVDRLTGGGLRDLHELLAGPLAGVFGGVHLLPFYDPIDGADAGFDPSDHTRVDARLGTWDDVRAVSGLADVMADLIVNHISAKSPQFQDYLRHGDASPYAGLFLTRDRVFPSGMTDAELRRIYRPRPGRPFTTVTFANGETRELWTTFTPQQIDIDVRHPQGVAYLDSILKQFHAAGIRLIRLDAAGYAIKKPGTTCFMIPETYAFIGQLTAQARRLGIEVLVEIHSHFEQQIAIARQVDRVYDFALPPLVLHALFQRDARFLKHWLTISPRNAITVLDTHDGIGVRDVGADASDPTKPGLLPPAAIDELVETIHLNSQGASRLATGAAASNLDLYQVNCTYYDALGCDDHAYLIARALQFFAPGTPQVYYTGLLAGTNDLALLERTKVGRDINRHYYTPAEVRTALQKSIVQRLVALIRFRNTHPAFDGEFSIGETPTDMIQLSWRNQKHRATLTVNFSQRTATIAHSADDGIERSFQL